MLGYFVEMEQRHVAMVTKSTVAFGLGLGVSVTVTEKKGVDSDDEPVDAFSNHCPQVHRRTKSACVSSYGLAALRGDQRTGSSGAIFRRATNLARSRSRVFLGLEFSG